MRKSRSSLFIIALIVALAAAGIYWFGPGARPSALCVSAVMPESARYRAGQWYWLEHPAHAAPRLVRDGKVVAQMAGITDYDADDARTTWSAGSGKHWAIWSARVGGAPSAIASRNGEPMGLRVSSDTLYWAEAISIVPADLPIPALAPHLVVYSMPATGGTPKALATIPESDGGIAGIRDGKVYVVGRRALVNPSMVVYTVPVAAGQFDRVVSDAGPGDAVIAPDGSLYWSSPSREASNPAAVACLRQMDRDGRIRTLTEWLPGPGHVVEADSGVRYLSGAMSLEIWKAASPNELPRPMRAPDGFSLLAADNGQLLLTPNRLATGNIELFTMRMP